MESVFVLSEAEHVNPQNSIVPVILEDSANFFVSKRDGHLLDAFFTSLLFPIQSKDGIIPSP